jgi:hypothetical protein
VGGPEDAYGAAMLRRPRPVLCAVLLSMLLLLTAPPARACACGGFAAADGEKVAASAEYAALAFDGTTERVLLSMNTFTGARDAALLIPTPRRATASLAEPSVFTELAALTEPETVVRYRWWPPLLDGGLMAGASPGSAGGAPVSVLETRQLGDLEVTSLAATDAAALAGWLDRHGYVLSAGLSDALQPYVDDGWFYTAIRLRTDAADLSGALQPLDLRFSSEELVYPMRLSVAAAGSQFVRTYVFADHRTERTDPTAEAGRTQVRFADRLDPAAVSSPSLAQILAEHPYLTATDQYLDTPREQIVSDFTFGQASSDQPYRPRIYRVETRTVLGLPAGPVFLVLGWIAANAVLLAGLLWRQRRARP